MHKRLAAVLLFLVSPFVTAFDDPNPTPPPIDLGLVVRGTDFYAVNFSTDPQVLFFRSGEFMTWRVVYPGAMFTSTYAPQALDGLKLEVAHQSNGLWMSSGSFELSALSASGADAIWVQRGDQPASWRELGEILTLITTSPTELPSWLPMPSASTNSPAIQPMHTPVVTPIDRPSGDLPPVLGDKPLPPM